MSESCPGGQVVSGVLEDLSDVERALLEVHRLGARLSSSSLGASAVVERARQRLSAGEALDVIGLVSAISAVQAEAGSVAASSETLGRQLGRLPVVLVLS